MKGRGLQISAWIFLILVSLSFISAYRQNSNIDLKIPTNLTSCTITITAPNTTNLVFNQSMTMQTGAGYANYTLSNSPDTGYYDYFSNCGHGTFIVTTTGEDLGTSQSLIILGLLGFTFLLFGIARGQTNSWKLKLFFDTISIIMGALTLNSIRIVATQSSNLYIMSWVGLIIGIILVSFMIVYAFILYTLQVMAYFNKKRNMRWETGTPQY